jgi:hypothetical protein
VTLLFVLHSAHCFTALFHTVPHCYTALLLCAVGLTPLRLCSTAATSSAHNTTAHTDQRRQSRLSEKRPEIRFLKPRDKTTSSYALLAKDKAEQEQVRNVPAEHSPRTFF